jgi:hypothetical protein
VHEEVGRGGMATVYRATRKRDGLTVAIKVLDPRLRQALGRERFQREIQILSTLNHPAILPLLDSGEQDNLFYYVMPFVTGETLRSRLDREVQLPLATAADIMRSVLEALEYAHGHNILHRDIKPANILLEGDSALVADFGIARAIVQSGGDSLSSTGLVIGTPSYMSPEQAAGESRLDGRSDIYSAGCLYYTMLAGAPPFTGPSPQAIQARHLHEPPPSLQLFRPGIPERVQEVVEQALAKAPADRFQTAVEFRLAVSAASEPGAKPSRARGRLVRWSVWAGVAALAFGAALWPKPATALDPGRYVVMPLRQQGSDDGTRLSAENCTRLLWYTLSRWQDLRLVDQALVEDRVQQSRDSLTTLSSGLQLARRLGAGLMIWGSVDELGDSAWVQAAVFRVDRPGEPLQRIRVALPVTGGSGAATNTAALMATFSQLARGLVLPAVAGGAPPPEVGTTSYRALRATLEGDSALVLWNLQVARTRYREAYTIDPTFTAPRLRYARASLWADEPIEEWRGIAGAVLTDTTHLAPSEILEARALVAVAAGDFPLACANYRTLLRRDSLQFGAWFGLGECLTRDTAVVEYRASPSGWRFRGSYAAGIAAYRRALTLVPLAHVAYGGAALGRLAERLKAQSNALRVGASGGDAPRRYAAFAGFEGDTLGFVPYPIEEVLAGQHVPRTRASAVVANRKTLLAITSEWMAQYPESPIALGSQAQSLELAGYAATPGPGGRSALDLVRQLRQGKTGDDRRDPSLAAWEVRLLLKARRYSSARLVAESALAWPAASPSAGASQAALAALIGQAHTAAARLALYPEHYFGTAAGQVVEAPPDLASDAARLLAYASFGAPAESLRAIAARIEALTARRADSTGQRTLREAVLFQPRLLAFPVLAPPAGDGLPIVRIEQALARNDVAAARREFALLDAQRQSQMPGDLVPDHVLLEARLLLLLGDSTAARARLRPLVEDPEALGVEVLDVVPQAAAIGRAIELLRQVGVGQQSRVLDTALSALWRPASRQTPPR